MKPLRVCRDCGLEAHTEEDLESFRKDKKSKYGRLNLCKKCGNKRLRKWYEENPEKHKEYNKRDRKNNAEKRREYTRRYREANIEELREKMKNRRKDHPLQERIYKAKRRAKRKKLKFNIDAEHLKQLWDKTDGICPMTGVKMIIGSPDINNPHSMSVDRIEPEKGYTKGNTRLTCLWYNKARSNHGDHLTLEMCQRVVNHPKDYFLGLRQRAKHSRKKELKTDRATSRSR